MYIGIDVYCFVIIVGGYTDNVPSSRLSRKKITTPNSTVSICFRYLLMGNAWVESSALGGKSTVWSRIQIKTNIISRNL